jgi:hypothetical protein
VGRGIEVEDLVLAGGIGGRQFLPVPLGTRPGASRLGTGKLAGWVHTTCTGVVSPLPPDGVSLKATPVGGLTA